MKKLFYVVLCAVVSMTIGVPSVQAGSNPKGKPFVAINDQIVEVKGSVSSLQEQIELLTGRVDTMEERLVADEAAVATVNAQIAAVQALVDNSLTNISDIQAEITLVQNDNANLNAQIAALAVNDPAIDALQAEVNANASMIATLEGSMLMVQEGTISLETSLQSQIDSNTGLISALQAEIETINENIALKQNLIDGVCPDGSAVQQINADGSLVCGEAGGGTSGQLETVYVWTSSSLQNGDQPTPPGGKATVAPVCPQGWTIAGAGYNAASGWNLNASYTVVNPENGNNYSITQGFNENTFAAKLVGVSTCIRIAP
jgi:peptidoglycan hydrolase CwlO-like protein